MLRCDGQPRARFQLLFSSDRAPTDSLTCGVATVGPDSSLEEQVAAFVEHYNHARAHESLKNLTLADVYLGRSEPILTERARTKKQTLTHRRLQHHATAAQLRT